MVTSRVFYNNFITSASMVSAITVTGGAVGQAAATLSDPQPIKAGSAVLTRSGTYTALVEKNFYIEAYSVSTGAFSTTLVRWRSLASGAVWDGTTWNVSSITPVSGTPISLSDGISVTLTAGSTSPQFVGGDQWIFRAVLKYGPAKAIDGTRDTEWRSGAMPTSSSVEWRIDLGTSITPGVVALLDFNGPSNSTTQCLETASNFTSVLSTTTLTWNAGRMIALINEGASRYWVLRITLTSTSLTYLRWSEVFLGPIESFDKTFNIGYGREKRPIDSPADVTTLMRGPGPMVIEGEYLTLSYRGLLSTTDVDRLERLRTWTIDRTSRVQRPFFFVPIDSTLTTFSLYQWANAYRQEHEYLERYGMPLELAEVVRSIAS